MNHVPSHILSEGAQPMSRRGLAKMRTRQALIAAAKKLFTEHGYAEATVRGIARATDMSTGAVFANFADKADLFAEVLLQDHEVLNPVLREAATNDRGAIETLVDMYSRAYAFHLAQLPLFQSTQAYSWLEDVHRDRAEAGIAPQLTLEILQRAVDKGQLPVSFDIEMAADLIFSAYTSNYRLAVREGATVEKLTTRLERQLRLVLTSVS